MTQLLPLAEFATYEELRRALRQVREHRNISYEAMNSICGAPDRYFEKIFGPNPVKNLGHKSFDWVFGGLGIKAVLVDNPEMLARIQGRFEPRDRAHLISATSRWDPPPGHVSRRHSVRCGTES